MMSNTNEILVRVREFVAGGGEADERADSLILRGPLADAAAQVSWLSLAAASQAGWLNIQIHDPGIGGDLTGDDIFDPARRLVITIGKPVVPGVTCFFLQEQLSRYFQGAVSASGLFVADLDRQSGFTTRGLLVAPWDISITVDSRQSSSRIDPTPFVRDFVPIREIPADLSPWILETAPAIPSAAFAFWKAAASRRLLSSLISSAWTEDDVVWLQASGPPLYRIRADSPDIVTAFSKLSDAARWVFLSVQDTEARHIIFASELARASRADQTFLETVTRAVECAKATYEAHIQSSSRETLKALSDLRKTVIDEAQKVTQKTQELTAGLWRDLAVTSAPFVLKVLGDAGKVSTSKIAAGFYFMAAAFIAVSFALQWRINAAFFETQGTSRRTWMQALYNYISPREREEIADIPIKKVLENYRETRRVLALIYIILFGILVFFGFHALGHPDTTMAVPVVNSPVLSQTQIHAPRQANKTQSCKIPAKSPCLNAQP